jgi:sec-independent protein translocase protein TatA
MSVGFGQLIIILLVILIVFGAGRLPQVMGDVGKGLKNLRNELGSEKNKESKNEENGKSES